MLSYIPGFTPYHYIASSVAGTNSVPTRLPDFPSLYGGGFFYTPPDQISATVDLNAGTIQSYHSCNAQISYYRLNYGGTPLHTFASTSYKNGTFKELIAGDWGYQNCLGYSIGCLTGGPVFISAGPMADVSCYDFGSTVKINSYRYIHNTGCSQKTITEKQYNDNYDSGLRIERKAGESTTRYIEVQPPQTEIEHYKDLITDKGAQQTDCLSKTVITKIGTVLNMDKDGNISILGKPDSTIKIDLPLGSISISKDGNVDIYSKKNITLRAEENITLAAKKDIILDSIGNTSLSAKNITHSAENMYNSIDNYLVHKSMYEQHWNSTYSNRSTVKSTDWATKKYMLHTNLYTTVSGNYLIEANRKLEEITSAAIIQSNYIKLNGLRMTGNVFKWTGDKFYVFSTSGGTMTTSDASTFKVKHSHSQGPDIFSYGGYKGLKLTKIEGTPIEFSEPQVLDVTIPREAIENSLVVPTINEPERIQW